MKCSERYYREVFREFNIGFVTNRTDECSVCKSADARRATRTKKHKRQPAHKADKAKVEANRFVGERDLKSVTDIPKLTHGDMFYKQALSCYTSIINNAQTDDTYLFNRHQAEGARGVNEMIQVRICFLQQQKENNAKYQHFIFWEDNCADRTRVDSIPPVI